MTVLTRSLVFGVALSMAVPSVSQATPRPVFHKIQKATKAHKPGQRLLRLATVGVLAAAMLSSGCSTMGSHQTRLSWNHQFVDVPEAQRTEPDANYHPTAFVVHYGPESHKDQVRPPDYTANGANVPSHYKYTKVVPPTANTTIVEVPGIQLFGYPKTHFTVTAVGKPKPAALQQGQDPNIPITSDYSVEIRK